jgi:hypothetical protein
MPLPVAPVSPCLNTKSKTAAEEVPELVTVAVPVGPVELTVPTAIVAAVPDVPVGPC